MNIKNIPSFGKAVLLGSLGVAVWGGLSGGGGVFSGRHAAGGGAVAIWQEAIDAAAAEAPQAASAVASNAVQQDEVSHTYEKKSQKGGASTLAGLLRGFVASGDLLWTPFKEIEKEAEPPGSLPEHELALGDTQRMAHVNQHDELAGATKAAPNDKHGGSPNDGHDDRPTKAPHNNKQGQDDLRAASAITSNAVQQDEVSHTLEKKSQKGGASTLAALLRGFVASGDLLWTPFKKAEAPGSFPKNEIDLGDYQLMAPPSALRPDAVGKLKEAEMCTGRDDALDDKQPSALVHKGEQSKDGARSDAVGNEAVGASDTTLVHEDGAHGEVDTEAVGTSDTAVEEQPGGSSVEGDGDPKAVDATNSNALEQDAGGRLSDNLGHSLAAVLRVASGRFLWAHHEIVAGGSFEQASVTLGYLGSLLSATVLRSEARGISSRAFRMTHSRKLGAVAVTTLWNPFVLMALPNAPRVAAAIDEEGSRRLGQEDLSSGQVWAKASGDNGSSAGPRFEEKQLERNVRSEPSKGTGEDAALVPVEDETTSASNEASTEALDQSFTLEKGMKQLNVLSRGLRGNEPTNADLTGVLPKLEVVVKSFLGNIQGIQKHYHDGKEEKAASAIKATIGDANALTEASPYPIGGIASNAVETSLPLDDIPNAQLASFLGPDIFDELAGDARNLADTLESINLDGHIMVGSHRDEKRGRRLQSEPQRTQSKLKKFGAFFGADDAKIVQRHLQRRAALPDGVCALQCEPDKWECHCDNLFKCVKKMTAYDLAVAIAGGYIGPEGGFESKDDFSLFSADEGIKLKLERIKEGAAQVDPTWEQCVAVLEEIVTACDPSEPTCSDPSTESFPLSVERVCAAVSIPTKFLFEAIGDEFDGFKDANGQLHDSALEGACVDEDGNLYARFYQTSLFASTSDGFSECAAFCRPYVGPGYVGFGARQENGNCACYFDKDEYPSSIPEGATRDTNRMGVGPALQTNDSTSWKCHPFKYYGQAVKTIKCEPLSYDVCRDFVVEFDRLYTGANIGPLNPMRRDIATSLWDKGTEVIFQKTQFPNSYRFHRDERGVVDRDFGRATIRDPFTLVNPATGKVLGLAGTGCAPDPIVANANSLPGYGPRIEAQELDPGNDRQYFRLSNRKLVSVACTNIANGSPMSISVPYFNGQPQIDTDTWFDTKRCIGGPPLVLRTDFQNNPDYQRFKIGLNKTLALNFDCPGKFDKPNLVITIDDDDTYDTDVLGVSIEDSSNTRLLPSEGGSNQEWVAQFVDPPYNYALLPGFPQEPGSDGCLGSTTEPELAKAAMQRCDESLSLLVGSQTSLGTLRAIADVVNDGGPMPGECCFDTPTSNDGYFGVDYDPLLMDCQNTGPLHLRISKEACENAGGQWFRSPCITLKECIASRPPKFDLDNPKEGSCQDFLSEPIAYVAFNTGHPRFPSDKDESGCLQVCNILPNSDKQVAVMTEQSSPTSTEIDSCVCVYKKDMAPASEALPGGLTRSLPKFSLRLSASPDVIRNPATGKALGLQGTGCEPDPVHITNGSPVFGPRVEVQDYSPNNPRQQFRITEQGQYVSLGCRNTADPSQEMAIEVPWPPESGRYRRDTDQCVGGSPLVLRNIRSDSVYQQFNNSTNQSIAINVDCSQYDKPDLVFTIEDYDRHNTGTLDVILNTSVGKSTQRWRIQPERATAFGLSSSYNCDDSVAFVEWQEPARAIRQKFYFTHDLELVSAACPRKVLKTVRVGDLDIQLEDCALSTDGSPAVISCPGLDYPFQEFVIEFDGPVDNLPVKSGVPPVRKCYPPNPAFSPAFDEFAQGLVIRDARDEDQCRDARTGLGFERDHPFDTEVCKEFEDRMCDEDFFDGVDASEEDIPLPVPPPIEFEAPEWPDSPDLEYERLSPPADIEPFEPDEAGQAQLSALRTSMKVVEKLRNAAKQVYEAFKDGKSKCDLFGPDPLCLPVVGCANNIVKVACIIGTSISKTITYFLYVAAEIAHTVLQIAFDKKQFEYELALKVDGYGVTHKIYQNLETFEGWSFDSLVKINQNIVNQHNQMQKNLQDRHQEMTGALSDQHTTMQGYLAYLDCKTRFEYCETLRSLGSYDGDPPGCDETPSDIGYLDSCIGLIGDAGTRRRLMLFDSNNSAQLQRKPLMNEFVQVKGEQKLIKTIAVGIRNLMNGMSGAMTDGHQEILNYTEASFAAAGREADDRMNKVMDAILDLKSALPGQNGQQNGKNSTDDRRHLEAGGGGHGIVGEDEYAVGPVEVALAVMREKEAETQRKVDSLESKVDSMTAEVKELKEMVSKMMGQVMSKQEKQ